MLIGMVEFSAETELVFEIAAVTIKHNKARTIDKRKKRLGIDLILLIIIEPPGLFPGVDQSTR